MIRRKYNSIYLWIFIFFFHSALIFSQNDSLHLIKIHFLYGSKPAKGFKNTEPKYFGGLHGGHISIEVDSIDYGFEPLDRFHIFPHKKHFKSHFVCQKIQQKPKYDYDKKLTTVYVPLTPEQYFQLIKIQQLYCQNTPYDYAFFGMRCASASQEILSNIGVLKKKKRFFNIITTFYPKKLRSRILKLAQQNHYLVYNQLGKSSRKWEKD